jgi:hypothetical protein
MTATDFGNSYMVWSVPHNPDDTRKPGHKPWGNWARILLEARCELIDEDSGKSDEFCLIAGCRTEWVYQEQNLFQIPSREYRGIWSRERHMSTGHGMLHEGETKSSRPTAEAFTSLHFTLRTYPEVTVLDTDEAVVAATERELPIVARTEIRSTEGHMRALIEYPVKTMNFHPERKRFQVDTGPILLPDFDCDSEHWIEWFDVAHVVYNTFDRAEFIIRRPTPVEIGGRQVCRVHHYSDVRVHEARHTLICAGQL